MFYLISAALLVVVLAQTWRARRYEAAYRKNAALLQRLQAEGVIVVGPFDDAVRVPADVQACVERRRHGSEQS